MDKELEAIKQIIESLDTLETEEKKRVLDYVFNRLGLKGLTTEQSVKKNDSLPSNAIIPPQIFQEDSTRLFSGVKDIRSLKEEKQPQSAIQMVALVAYYLSEVAPVEERKDTISSEDITKYFKQAGFSLPKGEPIYTLRNARNAGYFDPTSETGAYKLNPVGYNLVAHSLPGNTQTTKVKNKKTNTPKTPKTKKTSIKKKTK